MLLLCFVSKGWLPNASSQVVGRKLYLVFILVIVDDAEKLIAGCYIIIIIPNLYNILLLGNGLPLE